MHPSQVLDAVCSFRDLRSAHGPLFDNGPARGLTAERDSARRLLVTILVTIRGAAKRAAASVPAKQHSASGVMPPASSISFICN